MRSSPRFLPRPRAWRFSTGARSRDRWANRSSRTWSRRLPSGKARCRSSPGGGTGSPRRSSRPQWSSPSSTTSPSRRPDADSRWASSTTSHTFRCASDTSFTTESDDVVRAVFYGLGSDGTVGANKNSIAIIGKHAGGHAQALLRLRLEEVGLGHDLAPPLRPPPHRVVLPDRPRRLRGVPPVRPAGEDRRARRRRGGRDLSPQRTVRARRDLGAPPCQRPGADRREGSAVLRRRCDPGRTAGGHGQARQHGPADLLLRPLRRPAARRGDRRDQGSDPSTPTASGVRPWSTETSPRSTRPSTGCGKSQFRPTPHGSPRSSHLRSPKPTCRLEPPRRCSPAGASCSPSAPFRSTAPSRSERPATRSARSPRRSRSGIPRSASTAPSARSSARTPQSG